MFVCVDVNVLYFGGWLAKFLPIKAAATKKAVIKKLATSFAVTTCQRQCIQEDRTATATSNGKIHISSSYAYNNMLWAAITRENIPQKPFINFTALLKLPLDVLIAVDGVLVAAVVVLIVVVAACDEDTPQWWQPLQGIILPKWLTDRLAD